MKCLVGFISIPKRSPMYIRKHDIYQNMLKSQYDCGATHVYYGTSLIWRYS